MSDQPIVTIVIPAYKAEKYISQALESIKKQIYSEWELLVVEDAFQDKTELIVREFAQEFPDKRIEYIRHETNKGLAATRNTAMRVARGKYITFLDHDDIWCPQFLEKAVLELEKEGVDLAFSTVQTFYEDEFGTMQKIKEYGPSAEQLKLFPESLFIKNYIVPSATVINSNIINEVGYFDENIRACEDYDYWLKIALRERAGKFIHLDGVNCLYRKHEAALTKNTKLMNETKLYVVKKYQFHPKISSQLWKEKVFPIVITLFELENNPWKSLNYLFFAFSVNPKNCLLTLTQKFRQQTKLKQRSRQLAGKIKRKVLP